MKNTQIQLSPEQLHKVQLIELEMLIEVKRICEKKQIHYAITGGTLLGAVRHGGFIPWDDDADVLMLRDDYEHFRAACETELDKERFYFQDHTVTPGYRWGYGKLRRVGTEFVRHGQEHMPYEQGIFIDIFPWDNVPDGKIHRRFHDLQCTVIRKVLWSEAGRVSEKAFLLRTIYRMLAKIPLSLVFARYERLMRKYNAKQTQRVRVLMFPVVNKKRIGRSRHYLEHLSEYTFEGERFTGVFDYEEYLNRRYGDWKTLPPESERKTHPISRLRLLDE